MVFELITLIFDIRLWLLLFLLTFGLTLTGDNDTLSLFLRWEFGDDTLASANILGAGLVLDGLSAILGTGASESIDLSLTFFVKTLIFLELFFPIILFVLKQKKIIK